MDVRRLLFEAYRTWNMLRRELHIAAICENAARYNRISPIIDAAWRRVMRRYVACEQLQEAN